MIKKLEKPTVIPYLVGMGIGQDFEQPVVDLINRLHQHWYGELPVWQINRFTTDAMTSESYAQQMTPVIDFVRSYGYAIKGPFEIAAGLPSINVYLRKQLDLYACVRPVKYFPGAPSPMRHPEKVGITIFRENTEDIYAGKGFKPDSDLANAFVAFMREQGIYDIPARDVGFSIKFASKNATFRIMRAAINEAIKTGKKRVTVIAKHNIDKFCDASFRRWCFECADGEFTGRVFTTATYEALLKKVGREEANTAWDQAKAEGKIMVDSKITDDSFQQLLLRPEQYEILVLPNQSGDNASDFLAAQVGGLGIAPGVNINYENGLALFEATHGTAPDIAGRGIANPSSLLLSFVMLFEYLQLTGLAQLLQYGIATAILHNAVTKDFFVEGYTVDLSAHFVPEKVLRTLPAVRRPLNTEEYCSIIGDFCVSSVPQF